MSSITAFAARLRPCITAFAARLRPCVTAFARVCAPPSPRPAATRSDARDLEGRRVLERAPAFHDASAIMQAVVLAGGLATRMRPHTLTVPKSMLPVAGRPFVDWQIERLVAAGLRRRRDVRGPPWRADPRPCGRRLGARSSRRLVRGGADASRDRRSASRRASPAGRVLSRHLRRQLPPLRLRASRSAASGSTTTATASWPSSRTRAGGTPRTS